ncbi:autotransporter, partial [Colwellia sp. 6M3]|uniref:Ig-like domain-containing protein n=1 Tax=Colwellia sp. 6M3 TaxID=2759849 RepID=UPI00182515D2
SNYDASRPSVAIQNVPATSNAPFTVTFTFSEAVIGFVVGDITLTNATASSFTTVNTSTYTALITPIADGTVTLNVNANVAQDSVGNFNTAATQVSSTYDASRPSVTIQNVPATSSAAFIVTFAFSEAVTGFVVGDISVGNGSASSFTTVNPSTYTALITPTADGSVTLDVNANVAQDSVGNFNTSATQVSSN